MAKKTVLVTGGNAGIGFALCKQLAVDKGCTVFLGARNPEKGAAAVKSILDNAPSAKVEFVQCDVQDDASVQAAAATIKSKLAGAPLYGLVNNAGAGLAQDGITVDIVINTNLYGPKRVCEAFIPLMAAVDGSGPRICMLGSGGGPGYVGKNPAHRDVLCKWGTTWEQIEALKDSKPYDAASPMGPYGFSKACLHAYTRVLAKQYAGKITVSTCSPGFIDTNMTKGFGAKKTADEAAPVILHILFNPLKASGYYYGSDALRSHLHFMRDPGTPEYEGDEDYDADDPKYPCV